MKNEAISCEKYRQSLHFFWRKINTNCNPDKKKLENNSFFNALSRNWDNLLLEDVAKMQCAVHVLLSKYHPDLSKFYHKVEFKKI